MAFLVFQYILIAAIAMRVSFGAKADETKILDNILDAKKYDTRVRPRLENDTGPVVVTIDMYLRSLSEIDDAKMEYSAQITFRQTWNDNRLKYDDKGGKIKYLTLTDTSRVWKPDLFFTNEKSGHFHNIIMPNVLMRIHPDGRILYSARISLKLSCPMDLHRYPMDGQTCTLRMASYAYTTDDIVFSWKEMGPLQIVENLSLPQFKMKTHTTDYCTSNTTTGTYSCLKVDFLFVREFSYYLLQIYAPSIILVILSWASFWLDQKATTARISIWVTTLLTLVIKVSTVSQKLPAVSYTKAIDVWTGMCFMFLYAAIVELAIVAQAIINEERQRAGNEDADESTLKKPIMSHGNDGGADSRAGLSSHLSYFNRLLQRNPLRSQRIDLFARILFPLAFAFFNLIYWATYARSDD